MVTSEKHSGTLEFCCQNLQCKCVAFGVDLHRTYSIARQGFHVEGKHTMQATRAGNSHHGNYQYGQPLLFCTSKTYSKGSQGIIPLQFFLSRLSKSKRNVDTE